MGEPFIFFGQMDSEGRLRPDFPAQQRGICKHRFAGVRVEVEIREESTQRSDRQNRALWALLHAWGRESGNDADDLKDIMLGIAFGHVEKVMPVTGEIRQVPAKPRSSKLSIADFCHLIEEVLRVAAECGVFLEAPSEYRLAKEAAAKKARRAA